jgi:hypothetical protein
MRGYRALGMEQEIDKIWLENLMERNNLKKQGERY